jgi:hypothetical protein
MSDHSFFNSSVPQFGTAEYARKPGAETCQSCGAAISDRYFRINGALACPICASEAQAKAPKDTHVAFVRGLTFGIGGAILGLIVYAAFGILSGFVIGYVSLAVGWIVGKAIKKGSSGIGGLRYQISAVILTYAAVSLAAIPIGISQYLKSEKAHKMVVHSQTAGTTETGVDPPTQGRPSPTPTPPQQTLSKGALAEKLLLLGLASPFLDFKDSPFHAYIGLFILLIGLRIAWQLTDETAAQVLGPFKSTNAPASPLSSP